MEESKQLAVACELNDSVNHIPFRFTVKCMQKNDILVKMMHFKNNNYVQVDFFFVVPQLVTNRGLLSVPGRSNQYLLGPQ